MDSSQVTVVFQGHVPAISPDMPAGRNFLKNLAHTRAALPEAKFILSTRKDAVLPENLPVDQIVFSDDPGWLPYIKLDPKPPKHVTPQNNINRQIVSSLAGLNAVTTPFALKIRTDAFLETDALLKNYEQFAGASADHDPIAVCSFFTLDSRIYEHMPFHVSDWIQFGRTATLQNYWNIPLMKEEDARYYETHPHHPPSSFLDRLFRTRLAVEQHIAIPYARQLGYQVPSYHNQRSDVIQKDYDDFLGRHIIVLEPEQIGLRFPKYHKDMGASFFETDCQHFVDWYALYVKALDIRHPNHAWLDEAARRNRLKDATRRWAKIVDPVGKYWYSKPAKPVFEGTHQLLKKIYAR